eukprot:CAMPEP_0171136976 /NCGR_PEP_ID=MMETSP0766_2-20121228/132476_1 /TAXON_ID=439317 /ORGANISM="Gambierdiscus australes, Strain CAWD 149" /LENGTH=63 /DNA_ID=CAMNT_0011600531 /DNA_START=112 /DNA_END=303 /DNA_ORIENTATION=+
MVLAQELHFPVVSTQRLYLPCPEPPEGSRAAALRDALDVSVLVQAALDRVRVATGWRLGPTEL